MQFTSNLISYDSWILAAQVRTSARRQPRTWQRAATIQVCPIIKCDLYQICHINNLICTNAIYIKFNDSWILNGFSWIIAAHVRTSAGRVAQGSDYTGLYIHQIRFISNLIRCLLLALRSTIRLCAKLIQVLIREVHFISFLANPLPVPCSGPPSHKWVPALCTSGSIRYRTEVYTLQECVYTLQDGGFFTLIGLDVRANQ